VGLSGCGRNKTLRFRNPQIHVTRPDEMKAVCSLRLVEAATAVEQMDSSAKRAA